MKVAHLEVLLISTILGSSALTTATSVQVEKYLGIIDRADVGYKHVLDDLCGMMDIAVKFKDPEYNYDPSEIERVVMRDGVNGTQEMVNLYNELLNATKTDMERWKSKP